MTDLDVAVTMVGMPSTGKSTYLAALYSSLVDPPASPSARLLRQPKTRAYLEDLRHAWLRGERLARTLSDSGELVELSVDFLGRGTARLRVPDIAGESFQEVFVERHADGTATDLVGAASGLLLFTHPDHVRPRVSISDLKSMQALVGDVDPPATINTEKEFDPRLLPAEVQIVDLLQWVHDVRRQEKTHRIALMISAWDLVTVPRSPREWLAARMPMLDGFLNANNDIFEICVYGVCAQGGDYEKEDVAALRARDRAYIVEPDGTRNSDVGRPLEWVAGL